MVQPISRYSSLVLACSIAGTGIAMLVMATAISPSSPHATVLVQIAGAIVAIAGSMAVSAGIFTLLPLLTRTASDEAAARTRLRQAEHQLAELLRDGRALVETPGAAEEQTGQTAQDWLTLPGLWEVTHSRLDLYHQIATGQARRSFISAQAAIVAGFLLLITFAVLAARTHTTAGAITTGALGAVSAALAGYISRTFVRSQESAANHLRAHFDQPLDFAKYLAAERLLAGNADLNSDNQAAILTTLVTSIVAPSLPPQHT